MYICDFSLLVLFSLDYDVLFLNNIQVIIFSICSFSPALFFVHKFNIFSTAKANDDDEIEVGIE